MPDPLASNSVVPSEGPKRVVLSWSERAIVIGAFLLLVSYSMPWFQARTYNRVSAPCVARSTRPLDRLLCPDRSKPSRFGEEVEGWEYGDSINGWDTGRLFTRIPVLFLCGLLLFHVVLRARRKPPVVIPELWLFGAALTSGLTLLKLFIRKDGDWWGKSFDDGWALRYGIGIAASGALLIGWSCVQSFRAEQPRPSERTPE